MTIMTVSSVCGFWYQLLLLLVFRVESNKENIYITRNSHRGWLYYYLFFIGHFQKLHRMFFFFPISFFFRLILLGKHIIIIHNIKRDLYAPGVYCTVSALPIYHLTCDVFMTSEHKVYISPYNHLSSYSYIYLTIMFTWRTHFLEIMTPVPSPSPVDSYDLT